MALSRVEVNHLRVGATALSSKLRWQCAGSRSMHSKRARLLARKREHLRGLGDRFGQLELPRVNAFEVGVPPGARRCAAIRRRAERLQMDIFNSRFLESAAKRRLGETRPPRQRQRADVDQPPDPGLPQASMNSATVVPS